MSLLTDIFNFFKPQKTDPAAIGQLSANWDRLDGLLAETPETVNGVPVTEGTRDIQLSSIPLADNLTSDATQFSEDVYIERTSGGTASIENGDATLVSIEGNRTHTGYVPESINMTVTPAARTEGEPINAIIDTDTFKEVVTTSGTTTFTYTDGWDLDPATYGITVVGTPIDGDVITVVYVVENRGTITVAAPTTFNSTGWNLFNPVTEYARVPYYIDENGVNGRYGIGGTYISVEFATTPTGSRTTLTVYDGTFVIPSDGYVIVTGYDETTCIYPTWSDWDAGHPGSFEAYTVDTIDFSSVMVNFPWGLCKVGSVADEINFNLQVGISRIERFTYSDETMAEIIASGRAYEADTSYIYVVRNSYVTYPFNIDGGYTVSDHGIEYLTGTTVGCDVTTLYGNNLKNKLERDVLTKSQDLVNNLTTNDASKALSAAQGYALNNALNNSINQLSRKYSADGTAPTYSKDSSTTLRYTLTRIGNVCQLAFYAGTTKSSVASNSVIKNIPYGYRPISEVNIWEVSASRRYMLGTDGDLINSTAISNNELIRFTSVYLTEDDLPT